MHEADRCVEIGLRGRALDFELARFLADAFERAPRLADPRFLRLELRPQFLRRLVGDANRVPQFVERPKVLAELALGLVDGVAQLFAARLVPLQLRRA